MRQEIIELVALEPQDGYVLTNKPVTGADEETEYVYSYKVYLGINDSSSNWREIPESEMPDGVTL